MPGPRVYVGTLFMVCSVGRGLDPSAGTWQLPQPARSGQDRSLQISRWVVWAAFSRAEPARPEGFCRFALSVNKKRRLPLGSLPSTGYNIEILLVPFLIRKGTYFSMTSFVSRAIISSSLVSMISVRTRAPQAVTSTTSFFCLWASRFLSVSMRMPSQSM